MSAAVVARTACQLCKVTLFQPKHKRKNIFCVAASALLIKFDYQAAAAAVCAPTAAPLRAGGGQERGCLLIAKPHDGITNFY